MRSLEKIEKIVKKYEFLYKNSVKMKLYYKKAISFISKKNSIKLSDFNLGIDIDLDEEISANNISIELKNVKEMFKFLQTDKIHFDDDKIYSKE
jgi:hypothetical protein